jgi:hypothetical protein
MFLKLETDDLGQHFFLAECPFNKSIELMFSLFENGEQF